MRYFITLILLLAPIASAAPATQPAIAWQGWSDDVFVQAKAQHKFVLLDLQAIWCHWCHVMDETTYRDPKVIALINAKYIAVKVDQDSRPDLSNRYEDYGWPATVVFGEDGKEIVLRQGYIEPAPMASVLQAIIDDPSPGPSVRAAATIHANASALSDAQREALRKKTIDTYDDKYGAWGTVQKFMDWDGVEYCMTQTDDPQFAHMAKGTLDGQLHLIDSVWGGVDQYSTDGDWDHPHYEKIMQMQAENLRTYANAYALWKDQTYLHAAERIQGFLTQFLLSPQGAFYTSMDADLKPGEHSDTYYQLDDAGRRKLGVPRVDQHIYARENGWAIDALATMYADTGSVEALNRALIAANWIIAHRAMDGGGFRHDETDAAGPYLGDTLAMGRAMLQLYCVTGQRTFFDRAEAAAAFIASNFTAPDTVGVATSSLKAHGPFMPRPELDENVMVARWANLLSYYDGKDQTKMLAQTAMKYLASPEVAGSRSTMVAGLLLADSELRTDPLHITIVAANNDPGGTAKLFSAAISYWKPYKRVETYDPLGVPLPRMDVEYPQFAKPAAFVCTGSACSSPAFTPEALEKKLHGK